MGKKKVLRKQLKAAMSVIELQEESLILVNRYWRCSTEYREEISNSISNLQDEIYEIIGRIENPELL